MHKARDIILYIDKRFPFKQTKFYSSHYRTIYTGYVYGSQEANTSLFRILFDKLHQNIPCDNRIRWLQRYVSIIACLHFEPKFLCTSSVIHLGEFVVICIRCGD